MTKNTIRYLICNKKLQKWNQNKLREKILGNFQNQIKIKTITLPHGAIKN